MVNSKSIFLNWIKQYQVKHLPFVHGSIVGPMAKPFILKL